MKRTITFILCVIMLVSGALAEDRATVTVDGVGEHVTVALTMEDDRIISVQATSDNTEADDRGKESLALITSAMVEKNSFAVDTISGATCTSNAVIAGAIEAWLQIMTERMSQEEWIIARISLDPISGGDIYQTEDSVILPMDVLRITEKVTPEDISHTMEYIEKTKRGEMKKREPLSVVERGDGTYSIIDGNKSYSALKQLGAKNIPVIVVNRPYHKDVETFDDLIAIQTEAESEFHQFVTLLGDAYNAEVSEHSDLPNTEVIHEKANENFDGDYGKVIDVLSAGIRVPAETLQTTVTELFDQDNVLCIYGHEEDNGATAYIRLSNGAVAEIQVNEAK